LDESESNVFAYPYAPTFTHTCPNKTSNNYPTVIRLGIACGFIITSGIIPSSVNGISHSGKTNPIVPFYALIDASLSPTYGSTRFLILNLICFYPSPHSLLKYFPLYAILSINPLSLLPFKIYEVSLKSYCFLFYCGITLLIITVSFSTNAFSGTVPSSYNLE
jgi:hypothetical protein